MAQSLKGEIPLTKSGATNFSGFMREHWTAVVIIVPMTALWFLFPYSGDDWIWASHVGTERLESLFAYYNGRYLGNLTELFLTRSFALRSIISPIIMLTELCLINRIVNGRFNNKMFAFVTALFLLAPLILFRQSIVWSAGFSNYVVGLLWFLIFLDIIKPVFNKEQRDTRFSVYSIIASAFLGFVTTLYVEHFTLFYLAFSIFMVIYVFALKFKSKTIFFVNLLSCVAGTALMFSNGAYRRIADGDDPYRTLSLSLDEILLQAEKNFKIEFCDFYSQIFILLIIAAIIYIVLLTKQDRDISKVRRVFSLIAGSLLTGCTVYILLRTFYKDWLSYYDTYIPDVIITVITLLTLALLPPLAFKKGRCKQLAVLSIVGIVLINTVLLAVTPTGGRCLFPSYMLLILYLACLAQQADISEPKLGTAVLCTSMSVCVVMFAYLFSIYGSITAVDNERLKNARQQNSEGITEIVLVELPYADYIHDGNPTYPSKTPCYIEFYGLNNADNIIIVSQDEYNVVYGY